MFAYTEGLQKMAVPEKLTLAEAAGVFEVWKGTKVVGRGESVSSALVQSLLTVLCSWQRITSLMRPSLENIPSQEAMPGTLCGRVSLVPWICNAYFLLLMITNRFSGREWTSIVLLPQDSQHRYQLRPCSAVMDLDLIAMH